jgi:hypothetical protein
MRHFKVWSAIGFYWVRRDGEQSLDGVWNAMSPLVEGEEMCLGERTARTVLLVSVLKPRLLYDSSGLALLHGDKWR